MLDSLILASLVTALNLAVGTTAGYAYARFRFPTVELIPAFFLMLRAMGLQNTLTSSRWRIARSRCRSRCGS